VNNRSTSLAPLTNYGHDRIAEFKVLHDRMILLDTTNPARAFEFKAKLNDSVQ